MQYHDSLKMIAAFIYKIPPVLPFPKGGMNSLFGKEGKGRFFDKCLRTGVSFFVLFLLISGCSGSIGTVNGHPVDRAVFEALLKEKLAGMKTGEAKPDLKTLREETAADLINETLMLEDAASRGIKVTNEEVEQEIASVKKTMGAEAFKKALAEKGLKEEVFKKRTRDKMIMSRFTESLLGGEVVTEDEIRSYYSSSSRPFLKPSKVLMSMLEFGSEAEARKAIKEMKKAKADFDIAAKELAAAGKATVSDYGWVNPDMFSPGLSYAIRNLRNGQYGGPFKGKQRYYLVKVQDREKEAVASLDDMRESIKNILLEQKRQTAFSAWLTPKRRDARVELHL